MAEPVVIKLQKPIEFGSRTVTELKLRPIKAKDLRRMKDGDSSVQKALALAGWLSGEVSEVIDELEGEDLAKVIEVVNDFFGVIQGTGESASQP